MKHSFITPLAATLKQAGLSLDATTANARIGPWFERVAHQRTGVIPQMRLDEERFQLMPLPTATQQAAQAPAVSQRPLPVDSSQHALSLYDALLDMRP